MAIFDFKIINAVVPTALLDRLGGLVRSGENQAVALEASTGSYLLAGVVGPILERQLENEDEIGRLTHDLNDNLIAHAVLPGDIKAHQLVLVLDANTRAHLEQDVPSLTRADAWWTIFRIAGRLDDDSNENTRSTVVTEADGRPVKLRYRDVGNYLNEHTSNRSVKNTGLVSDPTPIADKPLEDASTKAQREHVLDLGIDEDEVAAILPTPVENDFPDDEDLGASFGVIADEQTDESGHQDDDLAKISDAFATIDAPLNAESASSTAVVSESETDKFLDSLSDLAASDTDDDSVLKAAVAAVETPDTVPDLNPNGPSIVNEDHVNGMPASDYVAITPQLRERLNKINYLRFKHYEGAEDDPVIAGLNRQVDQYNAEIKNREQQARFAILDAYSKTLTNNFEQTTQQLDIHQGSQLVKAQYDQQVLAKDTAREQEMEKIITAKQRELERELMGQSFRDYKESKIKLLEQQYRDEFYVSRVAQPLNEFKNQQAAHLAQDKERFRVEFYSWLTEIKEAAQATDQLKAQNYAFSRGNDQIKTDVAAIAKMQQELNKHSKEMVASQYRARAAADYAEKLDVVDHSTTEIKRLNDQIKHEKSRTDRLERDKAELADQVSLKNDEIAMLQRQKDSAERRYESWKQMNNVMQPVYQPVSSPVTSQPTASAVQMQGAPTQPPVQQPNYETPQAAEAKGKRSFFGLSRKSRHLLPES